MTTDDSIDTLESFVTNSIEADYDSEANNAADINSNPAGAESTDQITGTMIDANNLLGSGGGSANSAEPIILDGSTSAVIQINTNGHVIQVFDAVTKGNSLFNQRPPSAFYKLQSDCNAANGNPNGNMDPLELLMRENGDTGVFLPTRGVGVST